jgi:cell division protease FtsH
MADIVNNNKDKNNNLSSKRFSFWWIYIVIMFLLFLPSLLNNSFSDKEITWQKFKNEILNKKAVEKIVIVNNEKAEVYIKKELGNNTYFKDVFKPAIGNGVNSGPHYFITIGSVESFERKLSQAEDELAIKDKTEVSYVKKNQFFLEHC